MLGLVVQSSSEGTLFSLNVPPIFHDFTINFYDAECQQRKHNFANLVPKHMFLIISKLIIFKEIHDGVRYFSNLHDIIINKFRKVLKK